MAYPPPNIVGHGAEQMRLICFSRLAPERRRVAGYSSAGPGPREIAGMAVCQNDDGYYVFSCDAEWNVMFDSLCATLDDAISDSGHEWVYPKTK